MACWFRELDLWFLWVQEKPPLNHQTGQKRAELKSSTLKKRARGFPAEIHWMDNQTWKRENWSAPFQFFGGLQAYSSSKSLMWPWVKDKFHGLPWYMDTRSKTCLAATSLAHDLEVEQQECFQPQVPLSGHSASLQRNRARWVPLNMVPACFEVASASEGFPWRVLSG